MKIVCICAGNMARSGGQGVSMRICQKAAAFLQSQGAAYEIVDLRTYSLSPCVGCGSCFSTKRCCRDEDFNRIYEKLVSADGALFVSPHYAPIPAKLCMLLEKMEELAFLHWWQNSAYQAGVHGLPVGIISHGGGGEWALNSYKAMVNDTIANALDTSQCRVVPYSGEWDTGISLPVARVEQGEGIFPVQRYDWETLALVLEGYVNKVLQAAGRKRPPQP